MFEFYLGSFRGVPLVSPLLSLLYVSLLLSRMRLIGRGNPHARLISNTRNFEMSIPRTKDRGLFTSQIVREGTCWEGSDSVSLNETCHLMVRNVKNTIISPLRAEQTPISRLVYRKLGGLVYCPLKIFWTFCLVKYGCSIRFSL